MIFQCPLPESIHLSYNLFTELRWMSNTQINAEWFYICFWYKSNSALQNVIHTPTGVSTPVEQKKDNKNSLSSPFQVVICLPQFTEKSPQLTGFPLQLVCLLSLCFSLRTVAIPVAVLPTPVSLLGFVHALQDIGIDGATQHCHRLADKVLGNPPCELLSFFLHIFWS